jgi:hypothetical protein
VCDEEVFMKLAILAAFVLAYPASVVAQFNQGPKEFAEIPWSSTEAAARTAMLTLPGVTFWKPMPDKNKLLFNGGTFAGMPVATWHLYFTGGKFSTGMVDVQGGGKPAYAKLKAQLISKYGRPKTEKAVREETETVWEFPASPGTPHTTIRLELHGESLKLIYRNESLSRPAGEAGGAGL